MIGSLIQGKYRVQELLGEGGMGVVYRALEVDLERPVALKFLRGEFSENSQMVRRFQDEAKAQASVSHPNITTIYTTFTWQERFVIAMELLDGEPFSAMIAQRGPVPAHICLPWVIQALAGLAAAHKRGIVHRDLKPANLMLTSSGVVKVMDFGIARIEQAPGLTRTAATLGTPYYMAPEQVDAARFGLAKADSRADIYSMGVTLYELLAGEVPFHGGSEYAIQRAHLEERPQPPTDFYPHIPARAVQAVFRAMEKQPQDRFADATAFARDLEQCLASEPGNVGVLPPQATPSQIQQLTRPEDSTSADAAQVRRPLTGVDRALVPESNLAEPLSQIPGVPTVRVAPTAVVEQVTSQWEQPTSRGVDVLLDRWFGHSRHPRLVGAMIVLLAVIAIGYGSFMVYAWLGSARDAGAVSRGSASSSGGGIYSSLGSAPAVEPSMPRPPAHSEMPIALPSADLHKPSAGNSQGKNVSTQTAPTPQAAVVAGRWSGSYRGCEDNKETSAIMQLTESPSSDPDKLLIAGRLLVSPAGAAEACTLKGVFQKKNNRLTVWAACGTASVPEFLAVPHASVLSLYADQMSGTVQPNSPCVLIQLRR